MDPAPYIRRVLDAELDELAPALAAIAIDGAKGVGKTATASHRATTTFRLDDVVQREIVAADLSRVVSATPPVLVDEWQRLPPVWDRIRRAVDDGAAGGSFLLTGSASPRNTDTHSGAGRIVSLRMRPLSLAERRPGTATVSLQSLLAGQQPTVGGTTAVGLDDYVDEILRSGFPGLRALDGRALREQLDGYLHRIGFRRRCSARDPMPPATRPATRRRGRRLVLHHDGRRVREAADEGSGGARSTLDP